MAKRKIKNNKVSIAKGVKISKEREKILKKKAGGSNVGEYKNVKKGSFCGPSGGAPPGSYPINTKKRGKAALSYARNAPNPSGIKACVYKKFPSLKKGKNK